jgi:hypothetical protein
MSKFKFVIQGGKKLIKLYRGETIAKNLEPPKSNFYYPKKSQKYRGRWFSPDKNEAKYFSAAGDKSQRGERILKTVNVSEKDYNIGNKLYKKVFGANHCRGDHCLLSTKNMKSVRSRTFNKGGLSGYYKGMI